MQTKNRASGTVALLAVVVFLFARSPVNGQVLSKWGHPVITLGWSPHDWDETGLGHYDGWPWRVPSYTQYRAGMAGQHYPWMGVSGGPTSLLGIAPPADEIPPPGTALVIVRLPAEAELWFDETKTTRAGSYRRFVTPPLEAGRPLVYTLRVHWHVKDADLARVEKVRVEPGKCITVDFLTVDSWTGTRAETLPQPRKVP